MNWRKIVTRMIVLVALLMAGLPAHAVDMNATIKGIVSDTDGLPVPNAEVKVTSPNLIGGRNVLSDPEGRYRFAGLPPGDYKITVDHPSFGTWESGILQIALSTTVSVDITLSPKDSGETIEVVSAAPAIDVESVSTGAVLDARFLKNVPSNRDYQSAITMAPGIVGGGYPNVRGSFDSSNQYYIDGVNTTDPITNTFSMNMNYDAIEAVEVITGGMDAEYGRSLGGAFNIVTKSGGNEFEGTAFLSYSTDDMIVAEALEGDSTDDTLYQQAVVNFGGPIVKDRVWFYSSLEFNRTVLAYSIDPEHPRDVDAFPTEPRDWRSLYLFGKVTAQPSDDHRVWVQLQADPTGIDNAEQSAWTVPSGETVQNQGGWLASVGHLFTPSPNMMVESQVFYQKSTINYFPILWKDCKNWNDDGSCADVFDSGATYQGAPVDHGWYGYEGDDFNVGEHPYASFNRRYRMSANSALTYWFDFLGEHEAKVGVQAELLTAYYSYPGLEEGYEYWTNVSGDPNDLSGYEPALKIQYDSNLETNLTGSIVSWYVQDVWKPFPRLAIRPGLRFDMPSLRNDVKEVVLGSLQVAPRIGGAFDLTGDGKTKVQAFYGRFYDTGMLGVSDLLNAKPQGYSAYSWDGERGAWADSPDYSVASTFLAHDDIRYPYADEYNVGLSREVGKNFGLDLVLGYEESRRFWEDDDVNLIWNDEGDDVIGYRNGVNEAIYRLRTPDDSYTKYTSVEMVARKQFSDNWTMLGSYTWSRAIGTNSSDGATYAHDIPQQQQFENGLLDYDVPHYFKVSGSYSDPFVWTVGRTHAGYTIGWSSFAKSGYTYRPLVWNDYYQDYANYASVNDGRYRLPMMASTDLRFMLEFAHGDQQDPDALWGVGFDVFNVFNDRTISSVDTRYDPEATTADQTFGDTISRQDPRYFQVLLRGEF